MKQQPNFFEKVSAFMLVAILMGIGMLIFHNILIHFGQWQQAHTGKKWPQRITSGRTT